MSTVKDYQQSEVSELRKICNNYKRRLEGVYELASNRPVTPAMLEAILKLSNLNENEKATNSRV